MAGVEGCSTRSALGCRITSPAAQASLTLINSRRMHLRKFWRHCEWPQLFGFGPNWWYSCQVSRSGASKCEGAVGQPEVQIEAQRAALEGREGIQVQWNWAADDLR